MANYIFMIIYTFIFIIISFMIKNENLSIYDWIVLILMYFVDMVLHPE